jgi:hypothetical protein
LLTVEAETPHFVAISLIVILPFPFPMISTSRMKISAFQIPSLPFSNVLFDKSFSIRPLQFAFFESGFNKRCSLRIRFRKFIVKPVRVDFNPQEYLIFTPAFWSYSPNLFIIAALYLQQAPVCLIL